MIEWYMRASVDVRAEGGRVVGSIEAGLSYSPDEGLCHRRTLVKQVESVAMDYSSVTDGDAESATARLANLLRAAWPDRAWFVEVWNAHEAVTQVYAPFGMPRRRPPPGL